jgi:ABC-type amino acid transport substrate-binding protein
MNNANETHMKNKSNLIPACLFIALVAVSVFALVACNKPSNAASPLSTLAKVSNSKIIHAVYIVYPPTVSVDKDPAHPSGFLVDVMNEIATRAGWTVEYSPTTFDNMALAVSSPNADVVVGAIFVNVPRAKEMAFTSRILYWQGTLGIATADKASAFKSWSDVDQPGIKIAVSAGTAEADYVKQHIKQANINAIPNSDLSLTLSEVTAGRANIAFGDAVTVKKFLQNNPGVALIMGGTQFNGFAAGFALKQDDSAWQEFLDESILALQADGTIASLSGKWGGANIWALPKQPW